MENAPAVRAFADRRLTRFLFKVVQEPSGRPRWLPTRRLIVLTVLFGGVGYPLDLLKTVLPAIQRGMTIPYRHPYEIPDKLILSMVPLSFSHELPLIEQLLDRRLLFLYDEEPAATEDPHGDIDAWLTRDWLAGALTAHLDTVERSLGHYAADVEADIDGYQTVVATVTATAAAANGYPATLLPDVARRWAAAGAPALLPYAEAERLLLERLPSRLLGFGDTRDLADTAAAEQLRASLAAGGSTGSAMVEAVEAVAVETRRRGLGYQELVVDATDLGDLDPGLASAVPSHPGVEVLDGVLRESGVMTHRALVAIEGFEEWPPLLLLPGPMLWIPPIDEISLVQIYTAQRPPADEVVTCAPL